MSTLTAAGAAKKALELAWDGNLPVDPEAIARRLVVFKTDPVSGRTLEVPIRFRGSPSYTLGDISGQASLIRDGVSEYYLCEYNSSEISYRTRFTMAHELGHVLLEHVNVNMPRKRDTNFPAYTFDPDEVAANGFAAELLMPEVMVRELFPVASSLLQLAEAFGVSTAAMSYRLKNLGLV